MKLSEEIEAIGWAFGGGDARGSEVRSLAQRVAWMEGQLEELGRIEPGAGEVVAVPGLSSAELKKSLDASMRPPQAPRAVHELHLHALHEHVMELRRRLEPLERGASEPSEYEKSLNEQCTGFRRRIKALERRWAMFRSCLRSAKDHDHFHRLLATLDETLSNLETNEEDAHG